MVSISKLIPRCVIETCSGREREGKEKMGEGGNLGGVEYFVAQHNEQDPS